MLFKRVKKYLDFISLFVVVFACMPFAFGDDEDPLERPDVIATDALYVDACRQITPVTREACVAVSDCTTSVGGKGYCGFDRTPAYPDGVCWCKPK